MQVRQAGKQAGGWREEGRRVNHLSLMLVIIYILNWEVVEMLPHSKIYMFSICSNLQDFEQS